MKEWIGNQKDLALLVLRIGCGVVFIAAGLRHTIGLEGYTGLYSSLGIPYPEILAPFVAWLELLGGTAILLGIFTRTAGILLSIVMAVAILVSRIPATYAPRDGVVPEVAPWQLVGNFQAELSLLVLGLGFFLMGAGPYSLDRLFFKK